MSQAPSNNPTQQVFDRVLARPVTPPDPQHGRLVHLSWSAPLQGDRLVQWYLNGEWTGVSASPSDREAWLIVDSDMHHEIEVLAVDPADAATSSPNLLAGADPPTSPSASVAVLRDTALPVDARLELTVDDQTPIDTALFSPDTARGGFGAVFGEGGFGYDASTGPGLGVGQLGFGPLGTDGEALSWRDDSLSAGPHTLRLALHDAQGHAVSPELDSDFTITRLPAGPTQVALDADLQLTWT